MLPIDAIARVLCSPRSRRSGASNDVRLDALARASLALTGLAVATLATGGCGGRSVSATDTDTSSASAGSESEASVDADEDTDTADSATTDTGTADTDTASGGPCDASCNPLTLEGCVEGQKCTVLACSELSFDFEAYACVDIQGDKQLGEACALFAGFYGGQDDCAEGMMCLGDDDTSGQCVAMCLGEWAEAVCPEGSECQVTSQGAQRLCIPSCDPLADDCADGQMCVDNQGSFSCVQDASGDQAPYATPCEYLNACNPGLACVEASLVPESSCEAVSGCCTPYCDLTMSPSCPGVGQSCQPVYEPPLPGLEHVGLCVLAP